jgi:hypothetical protein
VRVLDVFNEAAIPFAVLHGEELIGSDSLRSDVDVVVGLPVSTVIARVLKSIEAAGLRIAVRWPYDLGDGTSSLFFTTPNGDQGAQVDLLYDPKGLGRYGLHSNAILDNSVPGKRYRVPSELDRRLYLLQKRLRKHQLGRVAAERERFVGSFTAREGLERAKTLFSPDSRNRIIAALETGATRARFQLPSTLRNLPRRLRRIRRPIGLWVELVGSDEVAEQLAGALVSRFGRWLVVASRGRRPVAGSTVPWLWAVSQVRLRAGLYVSWTTVLRLPRADLTIQLEDVDDLESLAARIVADMVERVEL